MAKWPFSLIWPGGIVNNQVVTHSDLNKLDEQQAQAADGTVWTDVAQFRNWIQLPDLSFAAQALLYNSVEDIWWACSDNAGSPSMRYMTGGGGQLNGGPAAGSSLTARKRAAAHSPSLNVMLFGGLPGASSNRKYLYSAGVSFSTTTAASSQTNTTAVATLVWSPALALFVAGHEGTGVVETSPDGVTFTARTVPNANARQCCAVSPTGVVVMTSSVSTNKLIASVDGAVTWSERTLPATAVWSNVVWVPNLEKFVAFTDNLSNVAFSLDGITWTNQPLTLPPNIGTINSQDGMAVAFGRTIFTMVARALGSGITAALYSQDGGATWRYAASFGLQAPIGPLASSGRQLVHATGTKIYQSLAGGL